MNTLASGALRVGALVRTSPAVETCLRGSSCRDARPLSPLVGINRPAKQDACNAVQCKPLDNYTNLPGPGGSDRTCSARLETEDRDDRGRLGHFTFSPVPRGDCRVRAKRVRPGVRLFTIQA
jgi:hypothetical protein